METNDETQEQFKILHNMIIHLQEQIVTEKQAPSPPKQQPMPPVSQNCLPRNDDWFHNPIPAQPPI